MPKITDSNKYYYKCKTCYLEATSADLVKGKCPKCQGTVIKHLIPEIKFQGQLFQ